jgi:hypothetical protein
MTSPRHPSSLRPDLDPSEAPAGSVRVANFDTRLSSETVAALAAVDENIRLAAVRASSIMVGSGIMISGEK